MNAGVGVRSGWGVFCFKFSSESVLVSVQFDTMTEKMGACEGLAKTGEGKITDTTAFRFD